jgi:hypothetical protein
MAAPAIYTSRMVILLSILKIWFSGPGQSKIGNAVNKSRGKVEYWNSGFGGMRSKST